MIIIGIISFIIFFYLFIYVLSLTVRRIHDLGKTTWLLLIFLIPILKFIFALYLLFAKGTEGDNKYGKDPLQYEDYNDYVKEVQAPPSILPSFMRILFDGRINRKRYICYSLPFILIQIILLLCFSISINGINIEDAIMDELIKFLTFFFIYSLFAALILIFQISLTARRLQDLDKNGFFAFLLILFPVNIVFITYLFFAKGTEESNKYGENPLNYKNYSDFLKTLQNSKLP